MNGKTILILAVSFSAIFIVFGKSFFSVSNKATVDMVETLNEEKALGIAKSATNIVVSYFWQKPDSVKLIGTTKTFFNQKDFEGGTVTTKLVRDSLHPDLYRIRTDAYYGRDENKKHKVVVVLYGPQDLTKMASYSESSGNIWWTGSDTVKGAIYCRSRIPVYNHPTFLSDVYSKSSGFRYYGGWRHRADNQPNVDPANLHFRTELKRPSAGKIMNDLKQKAKNGGWYLWGNNKGTNRYHGRRINWNSPSLDTLYIELKGQNMDVKFSKNDPPVTYNIATKVPNKVIYANNYVVRLKGELDGQLLISCNGKRQKGKGKVLLDDDLVYKDDPRDGPSDDLLGIVAQNYVEIADTPPNQSDINIQAAIYVQSKGLTAENAKTKPDAGTINFYGSLIEGRRMEVGKFDPTTGQLWGYGRKYEYDERLKTISPPSFPKLAGFNVLAWYEGDPPQ